MTTSTTSWNVSHVTGLIAGRARALLPQRADLAAMSQRPRRDLIAGITVGIVALPLALAFGITSGLGATAGVTTAIVAGALAALFGGSRVQVSGPTGAMTVVLIPIVASYGAAGVLTVGAMAGLMLIVMAALRIGRFIRLIPLPVIEGFTLGIAIVIALQQVPYALGRQGTPESALAGAFHAVQSWLTDGSATAPALTFGVAAFMLLGSRWRSTVPWSLVAVGLATLIAEVAALPTPRIGALPQSLPTPSLPEIAWVDLRILVVPALAVAALTALESLLSATVADSMSVGQRHDPDRELFGQGIANLGSSLFGGIPATAAIARTAVNVRAGAHSRLAAIVHAGALVLIITTVAPVVAKIPIAALAGVLIATTVRMADPAAMRRLIRVNRSEAAVFALTAVATVALDLVTAVILGLLVAGVLALRQMAASTSVTEEPLTLEHHTDEERHLMDRHVVAFRVDGPLFFAGVHEALSVLAGVHDTRVVILRLSRLGSLDVTGATVLRDTIAELEGRRITVMLSGLHPDHEQTLESWGALDALATRKHVFASTPDAIRHALDHATRRDVHDHAE